jgi:hypothetical protein
MTELEKMIEADREREVLTAQELENHFSNVQAEMSRHKQAIAHIQSVFILRTCGKG